jgi:hypothetical protein
MSQMMNWKHSNKSIVLDVNATVFELEVSLYYIFMG